MAKIYLRLFEPIKIKFIVTPNNTTICEVTTHRSSEYPNGRKFVGKAKLSPEDEYNQEFGNKLAKARALDKVTAANQKILSKAIDEAQAEYMDTLRHLASYQKKIMAKDEEVVQLYRELVEME